ncbi:MAG: tetratricopeptide repeat protein [Treponema sp.]|jgi:tetratricopeptide (TPR) repeat protein|nr:tetratricopeptide repeat protein [Treponema sp.]
MKTGAFLASALGIGALLFSCQSFGTSAEEYYSIGMAYFEMGKYEEAERWLSRAEAADKTQIASEYNLGRIAFETGRYEDAVRYFERVLARDEYNVMVLRALAYTRIKTGEIEKAGALYERVLALVPDSLDDGYNHALILFAMEKYEDAEELLGAKGFILEENKDMLLLYARTQRAMGKVEAADSYGRWLLENDDARVRYEYAGVLEDAELYARALEEYQAILANIAADSVNPAKADVRFDTARLLLIADSENPQGMTELRAAVEDGFGDREALETLAADERILEEDREDILEIIKNLRTPPAPPEETPEESEETGESEESGEDAELS